ncbi:mechanosensitive ion channel family protein [Buchananella hordeovulneris]|nr:mechanosensitive ion channel domain-containing protein [Buchananella hordeovulneris]MDO5080271.1 mechanosensitive ion channel [Buchananella hordeovulneris]RRD52909.1 mechanosensitive ion channel family protein [Buchananella hordeovulneris]
MNAGANIGEVTGLVVAGVVAGLAGAWLLLLLLRLVDRRYADHKELRRPIVVPVFTVGAVGGALLSAHIKWLWRGLRELPTWAEVLDRVLVIALIAAVTWLVSRSLRIVELRLVERNEADARALRRIRTQAQVLRRVGQAFVWAAGVFAIAMTFPGARGTVGSLLASAGLISLVAGLAAQSALGNLFAGLQLAFTDALRMDDVVVVENTTGKVEEITLTYVVVRVWDDRRLILPSTYFTSTPFENWSRRDDAMRGTVFFDLDWAVPMGQLRTVVEEVVHPSPLWDGRECTVEVTNAKGGSIEVRVVVSAANPTRLWELRCLVRETVVQWLQREARESLPRTRVASEAWPEQPSLQAAAAVADAAQQARQTEGLAQAEREQQELARRRAAARKRTKGLGKK